MKENLQQSLRKIRILEDRVDQLRKVKKKNEAILKSKKLFHLSTSFTVILLLNENFELFDELLGVSLRAWETLMKLHANYTFNLNWKKQVLAFELLALIHAQKRKYKTGLKAIYAAQTIVSELDETVERNLDYIMAVNTLTGFLLLSINKPQEALEFVLIAERIVYKLIEQKKSNSGKVHQMPTEGNAITSLEVIGENGIEEQLTSARIVMGSYSSTQGPQGGQNPGPFHRRKSSNRSDEEFKQPSKFTATSLNKDSAAGFEMGGPKNSCLSPTLLSNYVLAISLLKNIAMKFAYADQFNMSFDTYMEAIHQIEQSLFSLGSVDASRNTADVVEGDQDEDFDQLCNGVAVSFLIKQHKIEILDNEAFDFSDIVNETFNKEFMNMLQVCIFVPFLHIETPKPQNVPKVAALKENVIPQSALIREVLNYRMKIGAMQKQKQKEKERREQQRLHEVQGQQESLAENSIVVGQNLSVDHSYDQSISIAPDEQFNTVNFPIFATAQARDSYENSSYMPVPPKKQQQHPKTTRNQAKNRKQSFQQNSQSRRSNDASSNIPRLYDVSQFASMVDPRQQPGTRKRRFKLSMDRGSHVNPNASKVVSPPAVNHRRLTSMQAPTVKSSVRESSVNPDQLHSKLSTLRHAVKRASQPPVATQERMANTMQVDKSWVNPAQVNKMQSSPHDPLPSLQDKRQTVTAGTYPYGQSSSVPRRIRQPRSFLGPRSDFTALNQKPIEQVLAEQRATDAKMQKYKEGARQHDQNIEKILANNKHDWTSLYSHPKLMGQYYWKDDSIHTNKQRAAEIKRVIQSGYGTIKLKSSVLKKQDQTSQGLLQPLDRTSAHNRSVQQ